MFSKVLIVALAASPLVAAHGKVAVVTGNQGGNTTALGIQGGIVPGMGNNDQTEVDTTLFNQLDAASDGLGRTEGQGQNTLAMMTDVVAMSGSTVPQVSSSGGTLDGTMHVVTTDGAGPYEAVVDSTGTGAFSQGTKAEVTTQVPGTFGLIQPDGSPIKRGLAFMRRGLLKRAQNVDKDYPFQVAIPAGTTCSGTIGSMTNVCLVKMANPNPAGPFGGVFAMQIASGASNTTTAASSASTTASTASTDSGDDSSSTDSSDDDDQEAKSNDAGDKKAAGFFK